jgi:pseudouridine-5'-phosphate glycosidase
MRVTTVAAAMTVKAGMTITVLATDGIGMAGRLAYALEIRAMPGDFHFLGIEIRQ